MKSGFFALATAGTLFFLAACGGGGGGGEETTDGSKALIGVVDAGPVTGAWVVLLEASGEVAGGCGVSGVGKCVAAQKTGSDGGFVIPISSRPLPPELIAVTSGGQNGAFALQEIPLRAPLALFADGRPIVISPVTSLIVAEMQTNGGDLEEARRTVATYLDLPREILSEPPAAHPQLKRACELIATFAFLADEPDPLRSLEDSEAKELKDFLQSAPLDSDLPRFVLTSALKKSIDRFFIEKNKLDENLQGDEDNFTPEDPDYLNGLDLLAEAALQAGGEAFLPLDRLFPQRLAAYLLFTYELTSFSFFSDQKVVAATTVSVRDDRNIAGLLHSVLTPLFDGERPGDDEAKRRRYFYNSTLSPFYFAESVAAEIPDVVFSDQVMLSVARGKAQAGLIDEAEAIISAQIFQRWVQGEGFYWLGNALIDFGRPAEAIAALLKAQEKYESVLKINAAQAEISRLQWLGNAYRRAGDVHASLSVIQYILDNLLAPTTYGSVIVGTWKVADEYIAEGRYDEAWPLVDFMYDLALDVKDLKQKVFYLVESARRYAILGDRHMVEAIYREVQAVRAEDGAIASVTWLYMSYMVDILYRVGAGEEAYRLAGQLPSAYTTSAFKLVATHEAVGGSLTSAMAIAEAQFSKAEDRVEVMTYFLTNESRPYIALSYIQAGRFAEARQALDQALLYLPGLTITGELDRYQKLVQRGYVKLAGLYGRAGDPAMAETLLGEAERVLAGLETLEWRVEAMADIAYGYHLLGQPARGALLLQQAAEEVAMSMATTGRPEDPATAVTLYSALAKRYERLISTALKAGLRPLAGSLIAPFVAAAESVFLDGLAYAGDDHDKAAVKEVDLLLQAVDFLVQSGTTQGAADILNQAEAVAGQVWVEKTRIEKLIADGKRCIIGSYAAVGQFETALERARSLVYGPDRYLALQTIANAFAERDDFPWTEAASIDSDHDGLPDFFHPYVTAEAIAASGLSLDPDTDGDEIPDTADRRPWYVDPFSW